MTLSIRALRGEIGPDRLRLGLIVGLAAAATLSIGLPARANCPPAGIDAFDSDMNVILDFGLLGTAAVDLSGVVTVLRGEPRSESGVDVIDTEIIAMDMTGDFMGMPVVLRVNPDVSSLGEVRAQNQGECFPADSFFDVFVIVEVGALPAVQNLQAVRVEAGGLKALPPLFDTYTHPPPSIPLVAVGTTGPVVASIAGESSHRPIQDPTFSIAAGGTLQPDEGHGLPVPPTVRLTRSGLGLVLGDELDALSFGKDPLDAKAYMNLVFSVRPGSLGSPNTGVNQEAQTGDEESSEYISYLDGSNLLFVPGDKLVNDPGLEDVDALTDQPARTVDFDDDGVPDEPVFFSLGPGSPSLGTIPASVGDLLVTRNGGPPAVIATAADVGLVAGDDIDAICVLKAAYPDLTLRPGSGAPGPPFPGGVNFDYMLFSLAAGSPSLASGGHSPGDVFVTNFSNQRPNINLPIQIFATAAELGLLPGDDLDALKCMKLTTMFEISGDGDLIPDQPGGCGDDTVPTAFLFDTGITHHNGDHTAPPAAFPDYGAVQVWTIQNPHAGDHHGPYAYPGTPAVGFMPTVDPVTDVTWFGQLGGNDNCRLPHVHQPFGIPPWDPVHPDPDPVACGHGIFIPTAYPIQIIPTRRQDVPAIGRQLADYLNVVSLGRYSAAFHRYTGPTTLGSSECSNPQTLRGLLIVTGVSVAMSNFLAFGPYTPPPGSGAGAHSPQSIPGPDISAPTPIRVGPALRVLPPGLVPEPSIGASGFAALIVLTLLRGARRRHRRASR